MSEVEGFDLRLLFLPPGYCNYRCGFCHEEGLPDARQGASPGGFDPAFVRRLADHLAPHGMRGVTISGGEPLLAMENVIDVAKAVTDVPLTIVTNGTRLPNLDRHVSRIGPHRLRLNLNIPTFRRHLFRVMTGQKGFAPEAILGGARLLIRRGVTVNLNCVVRRETNDTCGQLWDYLQTAIQNECQGVRFLTDSPLLAHRIAQGLAACGLQVEGSRRGRRISSFGRLAGCLVELVQCHLQTNVPVSLYDDGADVYVTARGSLKIGLWGRELSFADWSELESALAPHLCARGE